jgi:hypothetical protein
VAAKGPDRATAVELLKAEETFEFAMQAPRSARDGIAGRGFLNQYETKSSGGTLDPAFRANVETSFVGLTRAEYDQLPSSMRPKYGYLRPAPSTGLKMQVTTDVTSYGEDVFVFKRDAIKDQVTCYPRDSLLAGANLVGNAPKAWHHLLLPWADRMLLAPGIRVSRGEVQFTWDPPEGFEATWSTGYLEIQIWRPLGIEDVERFEFGSTPPSGAFLKALRDHGVKIIKQGTTEEWKGDLGRTSFRVIHRAPSSPFVETA